MKETVLKIAREKLKADVNMDTNLSDVVHDSMAKIEVLFEIEEALGIKMSEEDLMDMETIGDLVRTAEKSS